MIIFIIIIKIFIQLNYDIIQYSKVNVKNIQPENLNINNKGDIVMFECRIINVEKKNNRNFYNIEFQNNTQKTMSLKELRPYLLYNKVSNAIFKSSKVTLIPDTFKAVSFLKGVLGNNPYLIFEDIKCTNCYQYYKIYNFEGMDITKAVYNVIIRDGVFTFSEKDSLGCYYCNILFVEFCNTLFVDFLRIILDCILVEMANCNIYDFTICGYKMIYEDEYRPIDKDVKQFEKVIKRNLSNLKNSSYNSWLKY